MVSDLRTAASQKGITLEAAIERDGWNNSFALAVTQIQNDFPEAFTAAEIVDARSALVRFARDVPAGALDVLQKFVDVHSNVQVSVYADTGFSEADLETLIEMIHYTALDTDGVMDATTSFDWATMKVEVVVAAQGLCSGSRDQLRRDVADLLERRPRSEEPLDVGIDVRYFYANSLNNPNNETLVGGYVLHAGTPLTTIAGTEWVALTTSFVNPATTDGLQIQIRAYGKSYTSSGGTGSIRFDNVRADGT